MSYEERQNLISLLASLTVSIPYFLYLFVRHQSQIFTPLEEINFWANAFLVLIPLRIVAEILMNIAARIFYAALDGNKLESELVDERDRLIELKSLRTSLFAFTAGFALSMLVMVSTQSIAGMFGVMLFSGFLAEMLAIITKIFLYRN
jgi:hypothetical protein